MEKRYYRGNYCGEFSGWGSVRPGGYSRVSVLGEMSVGKLSSRETVLQPYR